MKTGMLIVLSSLAAGQALAQSYVLTDLGTIHGESHAFAVGPSVVGSSTGADSHFVGTRFNPGPSPILPLAGLREAVAFAIRADGRVVGVSYTLGELGVRGFVDTGAGPVDLGPVCARAINAAGDIAGTTTQTTAVFGGITLPRACVIRGGSLVLLPTLGGESAQALAINAAGWVAGSATNTNNLRSRPCLWIGTTASDLGTLGGAMGQVYDLTADTAVGTSQITTGQMHATLWRLSPTGAVNARVDLGPPGEPSIAHAINAAGDVVGTSNFHAYLWHAGTPINLNTLVCASGWVLETAWDIDNSGRIVGSGSLWGFPRAFILEPTPACRVDFNRDGTVDFNDYLEFLNLFNTGAPPSDLNGDCAVDFNDYLEFLNLYNVGC